MAAPVSVAAALPVSRSTTCTRPVSPSTPHSASLFAEPVRGRGNANPAREKPPTQPRNLPCILRTEIERLRVQPLCFLRTRIVGSDAAESGHAALRTGRGRGCYETRQSRWGLQTRCTHLNQRHGFTGAWFPFRL